MVALVRNPAVTLNAYGSYVTPIPGNIGSHLLSSIVMQYMCGGMYCVGGMRSSQDLEIVC